MKRDCIVSCTITKDEERVLRQLIREYEDKEDKSITRSEFFRRFVFLPYLNGNSPSVPDSKPDTEQTLEPVIYGKYAHLLEDV